MSYIMVSADFPDVTSNERKAIYECLEKQDWIKVRESGRDVSTIWYAKYKTTVSEKDAIEVTIEEFENCASSYCNPKLVIHWGLNKPSFHGLM